MKFKVPLALLLLSILCSPALNTFAVGRVLSDIENETVKIYNDMTVSGKLHIINSTLIFHGHRLVAKPGSNLLIEDSKITGAGFSILIEKGAKFRLLNSEVSNFGVEDLEAFKDAAAGKKLAIYNRYIWIGPDFTRDVGLYGEDGIVIKGDKAEIIGNVFRNYTGIRIYSSNNLIKGNRFLRMKHEGLAFMSGSNGNLVVDNYFGLAERMDREIFGLRFYPGTENEEVHNNTFEMLPIGMMVANIPPWDAGENFKVHDNVFRDVIFGFIGKLKDSHIFNETYVHDLYPIHLEACVNLTFENSIISDVTFQPEEINRAYFREVWSRGLLKNMAYWMFDFYCSKAMLGLGWSGYNITIRNNVFSDAPPYAMAIDFDIAKGIRQVHIVDNKFINIGNYVPKGYIIRNDWTGYSRIANVTPIEGACIALEGGDDIYIEHNSFLKVLYGISSSSPDGLGNFGNLVIRDNSFLGLGRFEWMEQRYSGSKGWWTGSFKVVKGSIGIALGMHYITKKWAAFWIYRNNSTMIIEGNELLNFSRPIVMDLRRDQIGANEMGVKKAIIADNSIENYGNMIILFDPPNSVITKNNTIVTRGLVGVYAPNEVRQGERFEVSAIFDNTSNFPLSLKAIFRKDGSVFSVKKVDIPPHSRSFKLVVNASFTSPGNHSISVDAGGKEVVKELQVVPSYERYPDLMTTSALLIFILILLIVWRKIRV